MLKDTTLTVGAAMKAADLSTFSEWLITGQRDLEIQDAILPDVLDGDWQSIAAQINATLDGYNGRLGIHGPFIDISIMTRDPRVRELTQTRLQQGLEFGAAIKASHMVIHSPFKYFGDPFLPHSFELGQAAEIEQVHKTLEPVVAAAKAMQCTLVIETIFDLNTTPLLNLVRSFESDYVRFSIDTGHVYITHLRGGPTPDQWAAAGKDLLAHIHLQDTDGRSDRHWAPGYGNINWYAFFAIIRQLETAPRLILEMKDTADIFRGAAWLAEQGFVQ
ncbi:MAG: sugar phosphate isomerase/epimerase family protein [Chloroflexota bacterium]